MNKNGASVSRCITPAVMSNCSVSPSGVSTIVSMACTSLSGIPYTCNIFIVLPLCIESKVFLKSIKVITAGLLLFFTPSIILRMASI